jgi:hypothetical protein
LGTRLKKKTKSGIIAGLEAGKNIQTNRHKDLDLLKKLRDLQKAGIITNKEFQEKKKKILDKV